MSIVITPVSSPASINTASPATFTGVNLGTPSPGRVIVICVESSDLTNQTDTVTCTIAGNAAISCIQETSNHTTDACFAGIFAIVDAVNSTGNVVLTNVGGTTFNDVHISVYNITGAAGAAPTSTAATQITVAPDPRTTTSPLTIGAGGGFILSGQYSSGASPTWNVPSSGPDFTATIGAGTSADASNTTLTGSVTPSLTGFSNFYLFGMVAASWDPAPTAAQGILGLASNECG
jgi:hypothetical protein